MTEDKKPVLPTKRNTEIELKEKEIEVVRQVISEEDLKTQYSQSERILLTSLERLAENPFSISEGIRKKRGIPHRDYSFKMLKDFVEQYSRKGKALNRKGIKEDVEIVAAYFRTEAERARERAEKPPMLTR